jgi:hypothetical protein
LNSIEKRSKTGKKYFSFYTKLGHNQTRSIWGSRTGWLGGEAKVDDDGGGVVDVGPRTVAEARSSAWARGQRRGRGESEERWRVTGAGSMKT